MKINELNQKPDIENDVKLKKVYIQFEKLLFELRKKDLPDGLVTSINDDIEELNSTSASGDELRKVIKKIQAKMIKILEKEVKLVPKNYYSNLWLAIGTGSFGVPIGVAFGAMLGNMAFLGIGLPIGLAIGFSIGSGMDKKAYEEGRQLDVEIKY
ncbi:MAG TPA: hypothetical protein PKY56_02395 [Candidatus Kapabacteria bacterium]|nr:hypothetical protein [Candidatus Kapabacteria bacterium]HPO62396.1 hypothetical protein [Candidatus Kapabacteria bacterium]